MTERSKVNQGAPELAGAPSLASPSSDDSWFIATLALMRVRLEWKLVRRLARFRSSGLSFLLRLASLIGKFGLSIYIARYLSLDDLGLYGLIMSLTMFAVVLYGGRIDYDLARQIVKMDKPEGYGLLRDQSTFFILNYVVTAPILLFGQYFFREPWALLLIVLLICWLESYSNLLFVNTAFLGRPVLANVAFFIRSGLWSIMVIVAGVAFPSVRSLWFILASWAIGTGLSIALNLWFLEVQSWPGVRSVAVDWARIKTALGRSFPMWIGSVGLIGGSYLDRFVVGAFLDMKAVGLTTFYTSFAAAVVMLVSTSILGVVAPKLVDYAAQRRATEYNQELRRAGFNVAVLGALLCVAISICVPYLAGAMHKPEIAENVLALWLLMAATFVRLIGETAYCGLIRSTRTERFGSGTAFFFSFRFYSISCWCRCSASRAWAFPA